MVSIALAHGYVSTIDEIDVESVAGHRWHAVDCGRGRIYVRGKLGYLHRFIMKPGAGQIVDHIDGDGMNNTRSNLRVCRQAENVRNREGNKGPKTSLYKGVYWAKDIKRWRAYVEVDGKRRWLGCFLSEDEAAKAYNDAAVRLHGEFARLNDFGVAAPSASGAVSESRPRLNRH